MKYILGTDPSGEGTSGFCLINNELKVINVSELNRHNFQTDVLYWDAHLEKIKKLFRACSGQLIVAIEDFLLNPRKANQFAGSRMETSKLIGIVQHYCGTHSIAIQTIKPIDHLSRFKDSTLCNLGVMLKTPRGYNTLEGTSLSSHTKDALRIAVYYNKIYGASK